MSDPIFDTVIDLPAPSVPRRTSDKKENRFAWRRGWYSPPIDDEARRKYVLDRVVLGDNGCWIWIGHHDRKGYGVSGLERGKKGREQYASRLSYRLFVGPIPAGLLVCHKCDNPPCCNPAHLFVGTAKDNMQDCKRKQRCSVWQKKSCRHGHLYKPGSFLFATVHGRRIRRCRECVRISNRKAYEIRREKAKRGTNG